MTEKISKDYIIEDLQCENCVSKIKDEISRIEGVSRVSMDNHTLSVEARSDDVLDDVYKRIDAILREHGHKIRIEEKVLSRPQKKVMLLVGLGCANCAARIEKEVGSIAGVTSASVDFVSKKIAIEIRDKHQTKQIIEQAAKIARQIEADVKLVENEKEQPEEEHAISASTIARFGIGAVLFVLVLVLKLSFWPMFSIALASYLLVGYEVVLKAVKNIFRGKVFDENFLMTTATIGAFAIKQLPEGIAVMLFYQIGEFFQDIAINRSRKSIGKLMDIRPDFANKRNGEDIQKVSPEEIRIGDTIVVKPGEKVPLDGKVIEGKSMLDTSALTGESVPREVNTGDEILSGSVNMNSLLAIKVTKEFGQSTVSKILDLVENASSRKAPTENFITKFARYYTPVVVFAAVAIALIPPLIIPGATFAAWINRALVFLVVSCPCALVVSIPLGFFGGIGGASRNGILVKGSNFLEALNRVDTVVFDKTGTLTKGVFQVTKIISAGNEPEETLLEYAAYAESYSNHPIAQSIVKAYGRNVDKNQIQNYDEISGHGIKATVRGKTILAGNDKLMDQKHIAYGKSQEAGTVVYLAIDGQYAGCIVIADEIKPDAPQAMQELKKCGVHKLVMLTGDNQSVAEKIGAQLGIEDVFANLLPDQKVEKLEMLEKQKHEKGSLLFVGDGINDAPVLARADVGVAMGGLGSDAAIEAADVVLMTDEPSKLNKAIIVAQRTRRIVWQNIIFAFVVKAVVLVLGAGGIATMWEAVFADVGVTLIAVVNAMRVMRTKQEP